MRPEFSDYDVALLLPLPLFLLELTLFLKSFPLPPFVFFKNNVYNFAGFFAFFYFVLHSLSALASKYQMKSGGPKV